MVQTQQHIDKGTNMKGFIHLIHVFFFLVNVCFLTFNYLQIESSKKVIEKENCRYSCAINCMDGWCQRPVEEYMKDHYGVDLVDAITEAGPNKKLAISPATEKDDWFVQNIKDRFEISVNHHGSKVVALVGHHGCRGNPVKKEEQIIHLREAKKKIENFGFNVEIVLLWVNENQEVERID